MLTVTGSTNDWKILIISPNVSAFSYVPFMVRKHENLNCDFSGTRLSTRKARLFLGGLRFLLLERILGCPKPCREGSSLQAWEEVLPLMSELGSGSAHTKIPCLTLGEASHDKSATDVRSLSEPYSSWSLSFPSGRVK